MNGLNPSKLPELPPVYVRDPQQTELGRRLLSEAIVLIDEIGFEEFNFKRLALALQTAEASVYRYFENKHKLLIYLVSWYWQWLEECLAIELHNLTVPEERLRRAIRVVTSGGSLFERHAPPHRAALYKLVVAEASKAYLTKAVDAENRDGLFRDYKRLNAMLAGLVSDYAPGYPYPNTLMSMLIETARKQLFFAQHLPSLTDFNLAKDVQGELAAFLEATLMSALTTTSLDNTLQKSHG